MSYPVELLERGDLLELVLWANRDPNCRVDRNAPDSNVYEVRVDGMHFCFVELHEIPALGGVSHG